MKKIISLCAALFAAMAINATIWSITPTSPRSTDNIRYALRDNATAGDTILLTEVGPYAEVNSIAADKDIVIMAADGVSPVVQLANGAYFKVTNGAKVVVKGLKFDGTANSTQYGIRPYDASKSCIIVENCEFYGFIKNIITCEGKNHTDSCVLNNCYFHNNGRAAVYFAASDSSDVNFNCCDKLSVTNSTFAHIELNGVAVLDLRNNSKNTTALTSKLRVDHCTFYHCKGYERMIQSYKSSDAIVTNCIMMNPLDADTVSPIYATYLYGSGAMVDHNLNYQTKKQYINGGTVTNNIEEDPKFVDAEKDDFTLGDGSPALGAGTDGSNLGAPRWWPAKPVDPTAIENGMVAPKAQKVIENGQLVIIKNGVKYNAQGAIVK